MSNSTGNSKATARVSYKVIGPDGKVKETGSSDGRVEFSKSPDSNGQQESKKN